jgi:hypothetical protein
MDERRMPNDDGLSSISMAQYITANAMALKRDLRMVVSWGYNVTTSRSEADHVEHNHWDSGTQSALEPYSAAGQSGGNGDYHGAWQTDRAHRADGNFA